MQTFFTGGTIFEAAVVVHIEDNHFRFGKGKPYALISFAPGVARREVAENVANHVCYVVAQRSFQRAQSKSASRKVFSRKSAGGANESGPNRC